MSEVRSHLWAADSREQFTEMVAHAQRHVERTGRPEMVHDHRWNGDCSGGCILVDPEADTTTIPTVVFS